MGERRRLRTTWRGLVIAAVGTMLLVVHGPADALAADGPDDDESASVAAPTISLARARASMLGPGEVLTVGGRLESPNGRYRLELRRSGDLVLTDSSPLPLPSGAALFRDGWPVVIGRRSAAASPQVLWSARTGGAVGASLGMLADGNLVLVQAHPEASAPVWQSRTSGHGGAHLRVSDEGSVVIRAQDGRVLWTAGASMPDVGLGGTAHIVYDRGAQRVWLIDADGVLFDTYPVSGRATNPLPGRYAVFSKSPLAGTSDGAVTMAHMVRFTHGIAQGIPVGFHAIPRDHAGVPLQRLDELGQPRSAGCVRQQDSKARQLYEWAPIGTPVVVIHST